MRLSWAKKFADLAKIPARPIVAGILLMGLWVIPFPAVSEWRVLGPMMAEPEWLDRPAVARANQEMAAKEAKEREQAALKAWRLAEADRRANLPRRAEAQSVDGGAMLSFGCSESGTLYVSMVLTGYETESGIVRVTHWVDDELPRRVPWFSVAADLELRVFTDRTVFVDQFLRSVSEGESVAVQVETFPTVEFSSPAREAVVAPIIRNCQLLATGISSPVMPTDDSKEEMIESSS